MRKTFIILIILKSISLLNISNLCASDLSIKLFSGTYKGRGTMNYYDKKHFSIGNRDFSVEILTTSKGFSIEWQTYMSKTNDPRNPKIKSKIQSLQFKKSTNSNYYISTDPRMVDGIQIKNWARIRKRTLFIYMLRINKNGRLDLQVYERKLVNRNFKFKFRRIIDGKLQREATGSLVRIG